MATQKKKARVYGETGDVANVGDKDTEAVTIQDEMSDEDTSCSESDMDADEEMVYDEKVNVEFEARTPEEPDFHGIRQLLAQLFLRTNIDLSLVTDIILKQNDVGSVIKQYIDDSAMDDDEEEDVDVNQVFGVISCVNLSEDKNKELFSQIRTHFTKKLTDSASTLKKMNSLFDEPSNRIGLIVNERLVNIPAQIAVPSFDSLSSEMESANAKGGNFSFTHFLLIAKKFRMKLAPTSKKKRPHKKPLEQEIYSNGEEEFFADMSDCRASYSVVGERDSGVVQQWDSELEDQYEPLREVIIFQSSKLTQILDNVKAALEQAAAVGVQ